MAAIAVVLLLIVGFLLARYLGRLMGDTRRSALGEVNRILTDLAAAVGGRFQDGPTLADHPLLGQVRQYGVALLDRGPLAIVVGVSYPADDLRDDRTVVSIRRASDRRWRVGALHQRRRPQAMADPAQADAQLARCFEIAGGAAVSPELRDALLRVGARAFALDVRGNMLEFMALPDGDTVYISDVARLRALVDQLTHLAEALLAPAAG